MRDGYKIYSEGHVLIPKTLRLRVFVVQIYFNKLPI
jgi:hypothetical protein